ncbi:CDP-diacylglycerol--glycerol-3-phosphate 3-phosphatidyltransferase [Leifsonia rubra CMS 76R]|nr:CDP-diacylglycerol--glycerol-3-phosphate 3-phosphatidyltransferase [Leifsonia rubra CMS 76R]
MRRQSGISLSDAGYTRSVEFSGSPQISNRVWTVPNVLSFIRLGLVPLFLYFILTAQDALALIVLVVSSLSDYLDGVIARRFNQITRLGQLLDPAADRLFIFAALIGLAARNVIPWWLFIVIVAREIMLVILGLISANFGFGPLPVHHLGKVATAGLFYALPILMLGQAFPEVAWVTDPIGWAFALWGAFLYWWAGFIYVAQSIRISRIPRG